MKNFICFLLLSMFFVSCAHFPDGTSVWADGVGVIAWVLGLGAVACFIVAILAHFSNSTRQVEGKGTLDNQGNVPLFKIPWFWAGVALTIILILVIIGVNLSK